MFRKARFRSGHSYKRPYFVDSIREKGNSKGLKHETNRKVRHLDCDFELPHGSVFKRLVDSWDYYDHAGPMHCYCHFRDSDTTEFRVIIRNGRHYFPK